MAVDKGVCVIDYDGTIHPMTRVPIYRREKSDNNDPANLLPFTRTVDQSKVRGHVRFAAITAPYEGRNPAARPPVPIESMAVDVKE